MRAARRLVVVLALGWLAGSVGVAGEAQQDTGEAKEEQRRRFAYRGSVEWIAAIRWIEPSDTGLNPGNRRFQIPQLSLQTEVRPSLRVELGSRVTAVLRPRGVATAQSAWATGLGRSDLRDASANWTELYLNWRPADVLHVTYGLQNFQWGPAELLAPSNRIFHEIGFFRDPLYYVRGRHLLRVNLSAGKEWSAVALAELRDNGEKPFVAGEPFRRQGQIKLEYSAPTGRGYAGATIGGREDAAPWFGGYFSLSVTEGLSIYGDTIRSRNSRVWYPVALPGGRAAFRRGSSTEELHTLAIGGLRYTFAAGPDARVEYVHQDAGYTGDQFALAALAVASAASPAEATPYLSPGLEFAGRRLALLSVRVPDLPPRQHLVIHGRYLRSLTDRSGIAFVTASLEAADPLVLFASASVTHGRDTAEFSRLARAGALAGAVWTW